ncbi:MAG TPA: hypothetical protein VGF75_05545 [Candidatus Saccharimonadales bacterium]
MKQLMRSEISPWMIVLALFIAFVLMCIPAGAQSTTVSATVVDQAGTTWTNGTWKLDLIPNPNATQNIYWNGSPLPNSQWHYGGSLDSSGAFSQSVPSTNFITPSGATYTETICPNATSQCITIIRQSIVGSTLDISATITANAPAPVVKPLPLARAYNDAEVAVSPSLVGYFYMNIFNSPQPRYWNGAIWQNFVTGVVSFSAGNLSPLFTTSLGSDPANPALTFTLDTAAANKVFANCTTSTAAPSFCSLTAAMIPALPYVPTGSLFYQEISINGGAALTQRIATNYSSFFTGTDTSPSTTIDAAHVGANKTCTLPATMVIDGYGRVTSCTNGTAPTIPIVLTASATGCSTPTGTGQACVQTLTWSNGGFTDTNYTPSCSGSSPFTSGSSSEPFALDLTGVGTLTNTTINVQTTSKGSDGPASFGTIYCIGVHN